jgi:deoxyribose-phosphate aldolase
MYTREQFAKTIDHTLLRPQATRDDIIRFCEEAASRHFATVCVFPCWVGTCAHALQNTDVKVCTVISFPFGADTRAGKAYAIKNAIASGAKEVDVVMNISRFKSGDYDGVAKDLRECCDAAAIAGGVGSSMRILLKVIIETCLLSDAEKERAAKIARDSGADFVKTSTGVSTGGATVEDIRLIRRALGIGITGIKASGGIKTVDQAIALLNAGANRIGTSSGISILDAYHPDPEDSAA